ncbi:MAG: OmpA family protein [Ignavibacteriae bacterium]|nr:OmpA family protein [Ignavibacteriota bacterium]
MSLLSLAAPIVMGFLSKHVKQQGVTDAAGFASMLAGQAGFLKGALPTGVTNLLGISNIDALAGKAVSMTSNGGSSVLKKVLPFLPIVAILLLGWWLLKNSGADAAKQTVETVKEAAHEGVVATASAVNALGAFFSMRLPSGVDLNIPEYGIENKLIGFIQDANRPVDKTTWFTFDRLLFETGKATMKPESREQLNNIAEILKAFPAVALKIGGYTDNTGNAAANMQLSQARAESVMNELVALGIDAQRLRAEGYGQEHPVADNGTEDGRAKNRRIDVRVTKK